MSSQKTCSDINLDRILLARRFCGKIASWARMFGTKSHLDFGCGDGRMTSCMASLLPEMVLVGYDILDIAAERIAGYRRANLKFVHSLNGDLFDSASCSFVLHETDARQAFQDIYRILRERGILMVLDYDLTNVTQEEFYERFSCQRERQEMQRIGSEEAYRMHTAKGIDDFLEMAEDSGFTIELNGRFSNGYFLFVGRKK